MSETAKALKFPAACLNSMCAQPLAGPVNHCPFCGTLVARAAPVLRVVPPVPVPAAAAAPAPAPAPAPQAAPAPAAAAPTPPPPAPAPAADTATPAPPKRRMSKIGLALVAVLGVGAYGLQQLGSKHDQQLIEQAIAAGKTCLGKKDYRCAIDNADSVLQKDRNEPRALSLKQQAQADLARLQKAEDDKQARLQAEASQKAAAERASQEQARARAAQDELDARRRSEELDRQAQELREQRVEEQRRRDQLAQEQQAVREQRQRAQERAAQQQRAQNPGNYIAPQNVFNRPGSNNFPSGSSTDDIIRQGQQMQQFQRQQQQQQRQNIQGQQQQNKDVIRSIIN